MYKRIYIEITNICNLKCEFCPDTNRNKEFMSLEKFEEVLSKIRKHTNLVCLHVKGEPLLHKDIDGILEILGRYNLKANITTNGTLIKEKLDIIKKSKSIRQLNISIHDFLQNKEMSEKYLKDIFESVEQLEDITISYRLWNIKDTNLNKKDKDIIKLIEDYYNIQNLSERLSENSYLKLKDNIFINQDKEFIWPNLKNEVIIEKGRCLALKEQFAILVDGTVVPCCLDNNGDIPLGNIFEETLEEILNKPYTLTIRKNFENRVITSDLCRTCGFLKNLEAKRKSK